MKRRSNCSCKRGKSSDTSEAGALGRVISSLNLRILCYLTLPFFRILLIEDSLRVAILGSSQATLSAVLRIHSAQGCRPHNHPMSNANTTQTLLLTQRQHRERSTPRRSLLPGSMLGDSPSCAAPPGGRGETPVLMLCLVRCMAAPPDASSPLSKRD
jgi:hypothetical protein